MPGGTPVRVISASRRVDMVAGYPDMLADTLEERCPPDATHTVVIWTKKPENLFGHARLSEIITRYGQLFILYSITGLGGTDLEPNAPSTDDALSAIPKLIALTGDPRRIKVRFDPIVRLRSGGGKSRSNIGLFDSIAGTASRNGILDIIVSWLAPYRKVVTRLRRQGFEIEDLTPERIRGDYETLREKAGRYSMRLHACCVDGLPHSKCIDGFLLNVLRPGDAACSTRKAKGQRAACGCTESWDIGWYLPCPVGCLYCYANPLIP